LEINDKFVRCAIQAAQDKKALDLTVLDVRGIASFTDSFIICSGTSSPQNQAIADEIHLKLKQQGARQTISKAIAGQSGFDGLFRLHRPYLLAKNRAFYNLERLWRDSAKAGYR
jgi:ribosome-associated protein